MLGAAKNPQIVWNGVTPPPSYKMFKHEHNKKFLGIFVFPHNTPIILLTKGVKYKMGQTQIQTQDLFEDIFSALVLTFPNEEAGSEPNPNNLRTFFLQHEF